MNSRTIIALLGIIACALLYSEQRLNIRETGRRSKAITALIWLIGAATVAAMIVSG